MDTIIGLFAVALMAGPVVPLLLYIPFSVWVVRRAIRYARENGKSAKRWGWGTAFVMYSLVFWDWIPTVAVHQYYCAKDSGFWVYKSLDQWKAENPGVMETLVANKVAIQRVGDDENHTDTVVRNQRFNSVCQRQQPIALLPVYSSRSEIVDIGNDEVLARYVDLSSGKGRDDLKFWMNVQGCPNGTANRIAFLNFSEQLEKMINATQRSVK